MRSLRDLDAELARHNLLFGRKAEKTALARRLMAGSVLLHGPGGMGKTTLMLHVLRDLGGMGGASHGAPPAVLDPGHSLYFEDLSTFVRFLGARKRPLTLNGASISFRWDEGGQRKEASIKVGGRSRPGPEGGTTVLAGSSPMFQAERLVVMTSLEVSVGPRFDIDEITKRMDPSLARFSERLGRAVEKARRGPDASFIDVVDGKTDDGAKADVPPRIATALVRAIGGSLSEEDREHGIVLNLLEEELSSLVESSNREVYLAAASYLRPDAGPARRLSLREFEDSLHEFLDNGNLDRLLPGELTYWKWYIGIDHLERGVPGWTLDVKKEAVRMIYENLSEKDGFHVITAVEPNPVLIFDGAGTADAGKEPEGMTAVAVGTPLREDFVREASTFILENVEEISSLKGPEVRKTIADLYDHCSGRIRLYYLVRSIKNLPSLHTQGMDQVEPDASFLDRQLGDALGQLGVRYDYDRSIQNLPAVQPLLELATMEERSSPGRTAVASRNVISWLLDVTDNELALSVDRYLGIMEAYGILRAEGNEVGFFDPYIGRELRQLSRTIDQGDRPLIVTLQSMNRLNRFLAALDRGDLLALSGHFTVAMTNWTATSRTDPAIYRTLLAALDGGGDFPDRRQKITILAACAVLAGVPFSPDLQDRRREVAELVREAASDGDLRLASLASRALKKMVVLSGEKKCVLCGGGMEDGHSVCVACRADYREVCPSCGERISPHFTYCAGCGLSAGGDRTGRAGDH